MHLSRIVIFILYFFSQILLLFILSSTGETFYDDERDDPIEMNISNIETPVSIENTTNSSSLLILQTLLTTNSTSLNSTISNELPLTTLQKKESINSLVDQINAYRNSHILSRIEECDSSIKLNDICEIYSIDNDTNSLIHQSNIEFQKLEDIFNSLIKKSSIQELRKLCFSSTNLCLKNISKNHIQYSIDTIQTYGSSFCSLDECRSRLLIFIDSCPTLMDTYINTVTLQLLPILCTLYNEQQTWNSSQCIEEIVYLFHIFYVFWPQIQTCFANISINSDRCTSECQIIDNILNNLKTQCHDNISFLSQVPIFARYQTNDFEEICDKKSIFTRPPLINSSKYRFKSNNRRFDNNHNCQYARLHDSSFELRTNSRILNNNSTINEMMEDESQIDSNDQLDSTEYQRLLFVNS